MHPDLPGPVPHPVRERLARRGTRPLRAAQPQPMRGQHPPGLGPGDQSAGQHRAAGHVREPSVPRFDAPDGLADGLNDDLRAVADLFAFIAAKPRRSPPCAGALAMGSRHSCPRGQLVPAGLPRMILLQILTGHRASEIPLRQGQRLPDLLGLRHRRDHRETLQRQLAETEELISRATAAFQQRHRQPIPEDNAWLAQRRTEHAALSRLLTAMQAAPGRAVQGAGCGAAPAGPVPLALDLTRHQRKPT